MSTGRNVGIYPEIKQPGWHREQGADLTKAVLKVLADHGYRNKTSNVFVQCFDAKELLRIRNELHCELKLIQLLGKGNADNTEFDAMMTTEGLTAIAKYADGIGPSIESLYEIDKSGRIVDSKLVERAHRLGLEVHPYTLRIDSVPKAFQSIDDLTAFLQNVSIDGAFSDFPDVTRAMFTRNQSD